MHRPNNDADRAEYVSRMTGLAAMLVAVLTLVGCGNILETRLAKGDEAAVFWMVEYSGPRAMLNPSWPATFENTKWSKIYENHFDEVYYLVAGPHFAQYLNFMQSYNGVARPYKKRGLFNANYQMAHFLCTNENPSENRIVLMGMIIVDRGEVALTNIIQTAVFFEEERGVFDEEELSRITYFVEKEKAPEIRAQKKDVAIELSSQTPTVSAEARQAVYIGTFKNNLNVRHKTTILNLEYPVIETAESTFDFDPEAARECFAQSRVSKLPLIYSNLFEGHGAALSLFEGAWTSHSAESHSLP